MPNLANIERPLLVIGCGRTASSYVQERLRHGQKSFQNIIENDIYRDVWNALTDRWWTPGWQFVADQDECQRRIVAATRQVLLTAFPSEQPNWVMKMIWAKHDPEIVLRLFPEARFLHLIRDPRSNVPSMMERLQFRQRAAELAYVEANDCALQYEHLGRRYLRIRQEDFVASPTATWTTICGFLGVDVPSPEAWDHEANTTASTTGSVSSMRADSRLPWRKLTRACRDSAERLGYRE